MEFDLYLLKENKKNTKRKNYKSLHSPGGGGDGDEEDPTTLMGISI